MGKKPIKNFKVGKNWAKIKKGTKPKAKRVTAVRL